MELVGVDTEELMEYEERTMASTWMISLDQVRRQDEEAAELLAFWGYLSNRDIWYELVTAGASDGMLWRNQVTENKIRFRQAMSMLYMSRCSVSDIM